MLFNEATKLALVQFEFFSFIQSVSFSVTLTEVTNLKYLFFYLRPQIFICSRFRGDFKISGSFKIQRIKMVLAQDLFPSGLFEIIIGSEGLTYNFR